MYEDKRLKPNLDWVWRAIPPTLILGALWLARGPLFAWAQEPLQRYIVWGLVTVAFLDMVLAIRNPLAGFVARLARRLRTWWERRRGVAGIPTERTTSVDQPITSLTDDQLGFAKYAYILARFIAHCDTPMTVGIHGEWGSGKTSLANLIRHFLSPRNDKAWREDEKLRQIRYELQASGCYLDNDLPSELLAGLEIIDLNAWQYASASSLWRALILRLSQQLEEKGLSAEASQWQRRLYYSVSQEAKGEIRLSGIALFAAAVRALLTYVVSLILPSSWVFLGLQAIGASEPEGFRLTTSFDELFERQKYSFMRKQMESIEEFQGALRQLVERLLERQTGKPLKDRKVVFFIDDLDRCLPTVALEIMETIKTFLDAPGCVYVLLCDQRLLGQGVKAKFREVFGDEGDAYQRRGREYVEKIIQVSFQIPPSNRDQLKEYAERALRDLYAYQEISYFDIVYATVADNPRKVKRLCRGLEIAFDMMQLTLGRPTVPLMPFEATTGPGTTGQGAGAPADTLSVPVEKSLAERKQEFAKVYCLQYGWPDALPLLRAYQIRPQANLPPVPAGVKALDDKKDDQFTAEERNLHEAYQALTKVLVQTDLRIFGPLLIAVDWGKARVAGEGAVVRHNPNLWRFLQTPPHFATMGQTDLKDYIEWSGVIAGEEVEEGIPIELYEMLIEDLDISVQVYDALKRAGITTVGEVLERLEKGADEMLAIRQFGKASLEELRAQLVARGILFGEEQETIAPESTDQ